MARLVHSSLKYLSSFPIYPPAHSVADLFVVVPTRAPLTHPAIPPLVVLIYLLTIAMARRFCISQRTTGRSAPFIAIATTYNLALAAYSLASALATTVVIARHTARVSLTALYCDESLWTHGLAPLAYIFYLSKYFELADTFLLVIRAKTPSFLHVYHHVVTVMCAYWLHLSHTPVFFVFILLNSAVHAVMYSYYAAALLGLRSSFKSLITVAQMLQFVVGIIIAAPMFWLRSGTCATPAQRFALSAIILHAAYLLFLFARFYLSTYRTPLKRL